MKDVRTHILDLEAKSRILEPDTKQRENVRNKVLDYTESFLENIDSMNVWNDSESKGIGIYDDPIGEDPSSIDDLLVSVKNNVDDPHLNAASGGHLAYVPGGGIYYSALGDYMAAVSNKYAGLFYAGPGAVRMENMLIKWMADFVGYPESTAGNLTSGGSIANLTGIVTARDAHGIRGRDFEKTVIYASSQMHHCLDKAIRIAGLSECILRSLPLDEGFRIIPEKLAEMIVADKQSGLAPFLVIGSAGTTDVGAIDPLDAIADITEAHGLWFHVDGAYGACFMLVPAEREKLKGIERSDSLVIDPHKGLFLPYGSGVILVRDAEKLAQSHHYQANYMQDANSGEGEVEDELSPADVSPELTKHFRGMRLWLPLKLHGVAPFRACLEEKLMLTRYFHEQVAKIEGIETGPEPDLSITYFRYVAPQDDASSLDASSLDARGANSFDANRFNEELINRIRSDGRVFLSSTLLQGKFVIRFACLSFRTHLSRVDLLLDLIQENIKLLQGNSV
jgi:glutamate/tyrosine decarboxylase-like PLP-dependent enzyme